RFDRPNRVSELALPQVADAVAERGLFLLVFDGIDGALEDLQLIQPSLRLAVEAIERLDRLVVRRIDLEDRLIRVDRTLRVVQLDVVVLAEHVQRLATLVRIHGELALTLIHVLELLPPPKLDVEPHEGIERLSVALVDGEHLLVERNGAL